MRWLLATTLYVVAVSVGVWLVATGFDAIAARDAPAPSADARVTLAGRTSDFGAQAAPGIRRALDRNNIADQEAGPRSLPPPPRPLAEPARAARPAPEPCTDDLRIAGAAYVSPEHGRPLVIFSGPDAQRSGARDVGMRIADKTVVAIYPSLVVLAGDEGVQCWIRMYGAHARDVLAKERREDARAAFEKRREEAKKKAAKRAARKRTKLR